MAEQDNLEDLIYYFKSLGFEGNVFEETLRKEYELSNAFIYIDHYIPFGDDLLRYKLRLVSDRQFNAYRLDEYEAFYRQQINIDHKQINGVDTEELEQLMAKADWLPYFFQEMNELPIEQELSNIFEKLWALSDDGHPDAEGLEIQSKLIFKYWPAGNWSEEAYELQDEYETKQVFKAGHLGIVNATLAYNIVSGNFDKLHELISRTGIEAYPGIDLKGLLTVFLSNNAERFELSCTHRTPNGFLDFCIPVSKQEGDYQAEYMELTFSRFPDIEHGVFNGIDTANLEDQMKLIDWINGDLYYLDEVEDVILYPYVQTIQDNINRLNSDEQTRPIAEYLQVKYWSDSVMEMYVAEETWQMKNWPKASQRFSLDDDTRTTSNLVQGRPVHSTMLSLSESTAEGWLVIHPTSVAENGLNPMEYKTGINRAQIEKMICMLPLDGTVWEGDIVRSIQQGERVPLELNGLNGKQRVIVSISEDLKQESLEVKTPQGRTIPFNFKLDPDWTSAKANNVTQQKQEKKIKGRRRGI